MQNSNNTNT